MTKIRSLLNEITSENIKHTIRIENVAQTMKITRNSFKCPKKRSANLKTKQMDNYNAVAQSAL